MVKRSAGGGVYNIHNSAMRREKEGHVPLLTRLKKEVFVFFASSFCLYVAVSLTRLHKLTNRRHGIQFSSHSWLPLLFFFFFFLSFFLVCISTATFDPVVFFNSMCFYVYVCVFSSSKFLPPHDDDGDFYLRLVAKWHPLPFFPQPLVSQ